MQLNNLLCNCNFTIHTKADHLLPIQNEAIEAKKAGIEL